MSFCAENNENAQGVEACFECVSACETCAAKCMDVAPECAAKCCDTAEIATLCARLTARGSPCAPRAVEFCRASCKACMKECREHAEEHCQTCADACERCIEWCEEVGAKEEQLVKVRRS